ncbi:MAG: hypothetical protein Q8Q28_06760 [Pseudomonadota bacterium]|nr:hypothetical protein [Pseudomonadota bacterium]
MKYLLPLLRGLLFAVLPFLVYFALQHFQPREVAAALLALILLRAPGKVLDFLRRLGARAILPMLAVPALAALLWHSNDPVWVLSYPVFMNALMFSLFAASLLHPPSAIERLARLRHPDLPPEGVTYTRRVTQVWCGFFVVNGSIAAWTAFAATREIWVLYNGLISYLLMGALFAGEWLYRRRHRGFQ